MNLKKYTLFTKILFTILFVPSLAILSCTKEENQNKEDFLFSIDDTKYDLTTVLFEYNRLKAASEGFDSQDSQKRRIVRQNFLMRYIQEELLYQEAKRRGLKVDESIIDREIEEMKEGHTELTFNTYLSSMMLTENTLREHIRRRFMIEELLNSLVAGREFSGEEMREYYDTHREEFKKPPLCRMQQIVVRTREEMQNIISLMKKGSKFEELASEYSVSPEGKYGGDMGFLPIDSVDEHFSNACKRLKKGAISDVIESQEGYRLYRLVDFKPEKALTFEEAKKDIIIRLTEVLREREQKNLLRRLMSEHRISINDQVAERLE